MKSKEEAKQWVIDAERACTPKPWPLPFIEVLSARFVKEKVVVAEVRLFDGLTATLQVSRADLGGFMSWGLYWIDQPGGAIECKDGKWKRVEKRVVSAGAEPERIVQGMLF